MTRLATPVSSSMVMNITPFAEPGICRTSTTPTASSHRLSHRHGVGGGDDAPPCKIASNPVEQFFAKLKHWLRKAAQRTTEAVYQAISPILDTVTPAECSNYFPTPDMIKPNLIRL